MSLVAVIYSPVYWTVYWKFHNALVMAVVHEQVFIQSSIEM